MKLKRFVGTDTRDAMQQIKATFGPDAVILSSHQVDEGIEIVAAIDFDETILSAKAAVAEMAPDMSKKETAFSPFEEMRQEITTLRGMLEAQLRTSLGSNEPLHRVMMQTLIELGMSQTTATSLINRINPQLSQQRALDTIMNQLAEAIPVREFCRIEEGGIYAFVGPTGVGKTTTLAKIAARFVLRFGAQNLGLITMDTYRIAAQEQLMVYGKILGVNVAVAEDEVSLTRAIRQLSDKKLILIDTAGMSPSDARVPGQMDMLTAQLQSISTVLVLPATSHYAALMEAIKGYQVSELQQCVITKLDESKAIGGVVSALVETGLSVSYLTDGQRVPEDIKLATKYQIVEQLSKQALHLKTVGAFSRGTKQDVARGLYVDSE